MSAESKELNVLTLPHAHRPPAVLGAFEALKPGEAFVLVNDHDPRSFLYEIHFGKQGQVDWEYIEQGPALWRVRIGRKAA